MTQVYARRQLLVGGAALITAGAAFAAEPRRVEDDFTDASLEGLVPMNAGPWSGLQDPDVVPERVDGAEDHGRTVSRRYFGQDIAPIMLVVSYHGPGSPDLKVHRPETCYAVAGFQGAEPKPFLADFGRLGRVPCVGFHARREDRVETVLYWTRVGDRFPQTLTGQRLDFLIEAARGYRADGLLFRASTVALEPQAAAPVLQHFARSLVETSSVDGRRLLLGSRGAVSA